MACSVVRRYSNHKSFGYAKFISDDDCVMGDVILKKSREANDATGYMRAGPRAELHFDPRETRAAIVTCGGLCPGLNSIVTGPHTRALRCSFNLNVLAIT